MESFEYSPYGDLYNIDNSLGPRQISQIPITAFKKITSYNADSRSIMQTPGRYNSATDTIKLI